MTHTVSDFIVERLYDWGTRRIYGYTGDGINGIMGALDRADRKPEFVQVRHEEMAAFMACAHAKFTGDVGVCMASSGPGAIHLLNGLYDAKMDHQPVVALVGQQVRSAIGSHYQQEVNLASVFEDVADYCETLMVPSQARHLIDRAFRMARANRSVSCIILPHDVQLEDAVPKPAHKHGQTRTGIGYPGTRIVPFEKDLQHAADVLNAGERVAILVGAGAKSATNEVIQVAETLKAGVAKALLGLDVMPDHLPYVTGSIGLLGTRPSYELMMNCDTLLMIGSSFPYSEFLPTEGQARGVQIDINPAMMSLRYPMEVNLVGDARETLACLLPLLKEKTDCSWQDTIIQKVSDWENTVRDRALTHGTPVNPQRVFYELGQRLPENALLATDTGTSTVWFAQYMRFKQGMQASASGSLASMGNGIPYAIAAKFAFPERPVFAFVGDGAMEMVGNSELLTIAKYRDEWANQQLVIVVLNNRDLNFVTWEMRVMEGNPKFEAAQSIPDFPYAEYARSIGLDGIRIDNEEQIVPAIERALQSTRPIVLEVVADPDIPPLPPHIDFEQAVGMTRSMLMGDPDRNDVIRKAFQQLTASFGK